MYHHIFSQYIKMNHKHNIPLTKLEMCVLNCKDDIEQINNLLLTNDEHIIVLKFSDKSVIFVEKQVLNKINYFNHILHDYPIHQIFTEIPLLDFIDNYIIINNIIFMVKHGYFQNNVSKKISLTLGTIFTIEYLGNVDNKGIEIIKQTLANINGNTELDYKLSPNDISRLLHIHAYYKIDMNEHLWKIIQSVC